MVSFTQGKLKKVNQKDSCTQTFDKELDWKTLLSSLVDDLAGVLSCMNLVHPGQNQSSQIVLQGDLTAPAMLHFRGTPEPLDLQGGTAPNFC